MNTTNQPRAARRIDGEVATNGEELRQMIASAAERGGIESIGILILRGKEGGQMIHAEGGAIEAMIEAMKAGA
jgi:hypothetical protein